MCKSQTQRTRKWKNNSLKKQKHWYLIHTWTATAFKRTVVNFQTLPSLHEGSVNITLMVLINVYRLKTILKYHMVTYECGLWIALTNHQTNLINQLINQHMVPVWYGLQVLPVTLLLASHHIHISDTLDTHTSIPPRILNTLDTHTSIPPRILNTLDTHQYTP